MKFKDCKEFDVVKFADESISGCEFIVLHTRQMNNTWNRTAKALVSLDPETEVVRIGELIFNKAL